MTVWNFKSLHNTKVFAVYIIELIFILNSTQNIEFRIMWNSRLTMHLNMNFGTIDYSKVCSKIIGSEI